MRKSGNKGYVDVREQVMIYWQKNKEKVLQHEII